MYNLFMCESDFFLNDRGRGGGVMLSFVLVVWDEGFGLFSNHHLMNKFLVLS